MKLIRNMIVMTCRVSICVFGIICFIAAGIAVQAQHVNPAAKHVSKKNRKLSDSHLKSGTVHFNAREYFTAIEEFRVALEYNPNLWIAYRFSGDAERELGQYEKATASYSKALLLEEDSLSYFGRGEANKVLEKFDLALADYTNALKLSPQNESFHFARGFCYSELKRYKEAIEDFTFCISLDPSFWGYYSCRGYAFFCLARYWEAIDDFNEYFRLGGAQAASYYYRGQSYVNVASENRVYADSAIANFNMVKDMDGYDIFSFLGAAYAIKRDSSSARKYFRMAVKNKPEDIETYHLWGRSEFNLGDYKRALELFNKQATLVKVIDSDLNFSFAMAKLGLCELATSLEYFAKSIELDSLNEEVYAGRVGALYRSLKQEENLITIGDLTHLIKFSKDKKSRSMLLASRGFMNFQINNIKSAWSDIDSAMILSPPKAVHYVLRALMKSNDHESTSSILSDYDSAIAVENTLWQPWLTKSYFLYDQKNLQQSCVCLKKAIELGAQVSEAMRHHLCSGKIIIDPSDPPINLILVEMLIKEVLPTAVTIDCDDLKRRAQQNKN
jgi:tetratricopeptide (TPR) repeat protein